MIFDRLRDWFRREPAVEAEVVEDIRDRRNSFFDSNLMLFDSQARTRAEIEAAPQIKSLKAPSFTARVSRADGISTQSDGEMSVAMDSALTSYGMDEGLLKNTFSTVQTGISDDLFDWFTSQTFIGYQACAQVSQNWLVNKALMIPAKDAVRNGYVLGSTDGEEIDLDVLAKIREMDKKYKINKHLVNYTINTRRFGVRLAIFHVESDDEDYYYKPFNIDGVKPGTYKGISQVDPNWMAPILDEQAVANPAAMDFYDPTYWLIAGQLYHKSHVVVARYVEPPDVLKPTYQYGGIPLTQLILERVYDAERTATEAPMLVQTKRLVTVFTDLAKLAANPSSFVERLQQLIGFRNNYGVYVGGLEDRLEQLETSLSDVDTVTMTMYQLVAAVSEVPATKLMGTSPKGFNATGEFEMDSYYDLLENIQTDLDPLLDRHHELLIKSMALGEDLKIETVWNPVSSPNAMEQAEINNAKAQTDNALMLSGAIDANDIRKRLIADPSSGYTGLEAFEEMDELDEEDLDFGRMDGPGGKAGGAKAPPEEGAEAGPGLQENAPLEEETEEPPEEIEAAKPDEKAEDKLEVLGYVYLTPNPEGRAKLAALAARAGLDDGLRPGDYHTTLAYSADGIPGYAPDASDYELSVTGETAILGEESALVLLVESEYLRARHEELLEMGAVSNYVNFKPHITLKIGASEAERAWTSVTLKANPIGTITVGGEKIGPVR